MITTTDKVHLKCDCVDGSIVNGIREQILFSFNLGTPQADKQNTTGHHSIFP